MCRFKMVLSGVAAIMIMAPGCVERDETIKVSGDGSVEIVARFSSDSPTDVYNADAAPERGSRWEIAERTVTEENGDSKFELWAKQWFPAGAPLPESFARRIDPEVDVYLRFPTELTMEPRIDGMYYHFYRRYEPRMWSQVGAIQEIVEKRTQEFAEKMQAGEELSPGERRALTQAHVDFAVERLEIFAREAFIQTNANAPQDTWLAAHQALKDLRTRVNLDGLIELLDRAEKESNTELFSQMEKQLEEAVLETIESAMTDTGNLRSLSGFRNRYRSIKQTYEVTEDLGDETFRIRVEMPGTITGSNAQRSFGDAAEWQFTGEMLRDRKIEIMVTSKVGE